MVYDAQEVALVLLIIGYKINLKKYDNQLIIFSKVLMVVYLLSESSGQMT